MKHTDKNLTVNLYYGLQLVIFSFPNLQYEIEQIIPFLIYRVREAYPKGYRHLQKVVIHCSGGVGRTGVALAWLVTQRGFSHRDS